MSVTVENRGSLRSLVVSVIRDQGRASAVTVIPAILRAHNIPGVNAEDIRLEIWKLINEGQVRLGADYSLKVE